MFSHPLAKMILGIIVITFALVAEQGQFRWFLLALGAAVALIGVEQLAFGNDLPKTAGAIRFSVWAAVLVAAYTGVWMTLEALHFLPAP